MPRCYVRNRISVFDRQVDYCKKDALLLNFCKIRYGTIFVAVTLLCRHLLCFTGICPNNILIKKVCPSNNCLSTSGRPSFFPPQLSKKSHPFQKFDQAVEERILNGDYPYVCRATDVCYTCE